MPVRWRWQSVSLGGGDFGDTVCEEKGRGTAKGGGSRGVEFPTLLIVKLRTVTGSPFRSWRFLCVSGKATNWYKRIKAKRSYVQSCLAPAAWREREEKLALLVDRDTWTPPVFFRNHVRPRSRGDGGWRACLEGHPGEVNRSKKDPTDFRMRQQCQSSSAGEFKVVGEHLLHLVFRESYAVTTWLVHHTADCIVIHEVGEVATRYERFKWKPFTRPALEFCEEIYHQRSTRGQKECFLGIHWRTSEANVGTKVDFLRAGTIRTVGAH